MARPRRVARLRRFSCRPALALAEIDAFLGLGLGPEHIAGGVGGPLLRDEAKGGRGLSFKGTERRDQWNALGEGQQREIASVVAWSYEAFRSAATEPPLPHALV